MCGVLTCGGSSLEGRQTVQIKNSHFYGHTAVTKAGLNSIFSFASCIYAWNVVKQEVSTLNDSKVVTRLSIQIQHLCYRAAVFAMKHHRKHHAAL